MNVFASNRSPDLSARYLADRHVVKMVVESAQILSTAMTITGRAIPGIYRVTHIHHPCVQAAKDPEYFLWVVQHGLALSDEYTVRFHKTHASAEVLLRIAETVEIDRCANPQYWPLAMPDEFKCADPHQSYIEYLRNKYKTWKDLGAAPKWKRIIPNNPLEVV